MSFICSYVSFYLFLCFYVNLSFICSYVQKCYSVIMSLIVTLSFICSYVQKCYSVIMSLKCYFVYGELL
jgi:hypothetical protein